MLELASPAKINLFLKVLKRRADGFHEIVTLMQAIDLADSLTFAFSREDRFSCSNPALPIDQSNLVCRALQLFRQKTSLTEPLQIHLAKNIPIEAGLGGGSSNAATTLWGLNELHGRPTTTKQLTAWAAELGSDVPFFLSNGYALCRGRGEAIEPLTVQPPQSYWIIKPTQGLSTPLIYRSLDPRRFTPFSLHEALQQAEQGVYFNDLEEPAFRLMPQLLGLKEQLMEQGFSSILMSGSGSALFCCGTQVPKLPEVRIWQVQSCHRSSSSWYSH